MIVSCPGTVLVTVGAITSPAACVPIVVGVGSNGFLPLFLEREADCGERVGVGEVRGRVWMARGGTKAIPAPAYGLGMSPPEP